MILTPLLGVIDEFFPFAKKTIKGNVTDHLACHWPGVLSVVLLQDNYRLHKQDFGMVTILFNAQLGSKLKVLVILDKQNYRKGGWCFEHHNVGTSRKMLKLRKKLLLKVWVMF